MKFIKRLEPSFIFIILMDSKLITDAVNSNSQNALKTRKTTTFFVRQFFI